MPIVLTTMALFMLSALFTWVMAGEIRAFYHKTRADLASAAPLGTHRYLARR